MAKAIKKSSKSAVKAPQSNDTALIVAMLRYGAAIGTALTTFHLEPGGNCDRSGPIAERAFDAAYKQLAIAAALPAQTMEGLSAKARAMPFIIQDDGCSALHDNHVAFLRSLAADAQRLAEAAMKQEKSSGREATAKGGAA